jgi:putative flippase GtrA
MKPGVSSGGTAVRDWSLGRFIVVGTIGFVIDGGILLILTEQLGTPPLIARMPSFLVAVLCTWLLHRNWTFKRQFKVQNPLGEFAKFLSTQLLGIGVNYSVFAALVLSGALFATRTLLALALASLSAMALTYTLAKKIVFTKGKRVE